jgi:hypothetical protein
MRSPSRAGPETGLPKEHETETDALIWLKFQESLSDQSLAAGQLASSRYGTFAAPAGPATAMIHAAIKAMRTRCERLVACILAMTFAR